MQRRTTGFYGDLCRSARLINTDLYWISVWKRLPKIEGRCRGNASGIPDARMLMVFEILIERSGGIVRVIRVWLNPSFAKHSGESYSSCFESSVCAVKVWPEISTVRRYRLVSSSYPRHNRGSKSGCLSAGHLKCGTKGVDSNPCKLENAYATR